MKTYCTCSKNDYVCRKAVVEHEKQVTFLHDDLWVCATCCLPHKLVWEAHVRRCHGCLRETCLPWTHFCQACYKIEFPNFPYPGLLATAKRTKAQFIWPLQKGLRLVEETPRLEKISDTI